jgi:hypothetical protein
MITSVSARDVLAPIANETKIAELVDLLASTYNSTSGGGADRTAGIGREPRELVIEYAACKAEDLAKYD